MDIFKRITFLTLVCMCLGQVGMVLVKGAVVDEGESWAPHVSYSGRQFVIEGNELSITCTLTVFDQLKWMHDGKPIIAGEGGYSMREVPSSDGFVGSVLTVASTTKAHAGEYRCTSFNPRSHRVFVLTGDLNSAAEAAIKLRVGRKLSLVCNLTNIAEDDSSVEWIKDSQDEILKTGDKYTVSDVNNTLIIMSAVPDDAGAYECRTTSTSSPQVTKQFSVFFFQLRRMPKSLVVTEAGDIELKCLAKGKPIPTVQWLKDSVEIEKYRYTFQKSYFFKGIERISMFFKNLKNEKRPYPIHLLYSNVGLIFFCISSFLKIQRVYAPLYPLVGIVIEIVLLVIVIIFFERRRAKQEYEESDTDQGGPDIFGHAKRQQ
ncbi:unnamed protein product, partial [Meganyctiphanes norvegica]